MSEQAPTAQTTQEREPAAKRLRLTVLALALAWACLVVGTVFAGYRGHSFDLSCWVKWSAGIAAHGLGGVYATPDLDYLPGFLWTLAGVNLLVGGALEPEQVWLVKAVALTADLLFAIAIARLLECRGRDPALALLLLLNPALLYDSWVWGQVDGVHTALVGGAALALIGGRPALGASLAVLATNMKPQTIAFLPYLGFLLLHVAGARRRAWIRVLAASAATQLVVLAPFLVRGAGDDILRVVASRVGFYPNLSMRAYNVWYFVAADPAAAADLERSGGVTYRTWGIVLFLAASVAVALPWMATVRRRWRTGRLGEVDGELFFALGVAGLAFFLFPTQMHERYLHPAVVFVGVDALLRGRYALYGACSLLYLLNLASVLRWRGLPDAADVVLRPRPIAAALLVVFAVSLVALWRRVRADYRPLRPNYPR